jgi:hypothetical protein
MILQIEEKAVDDALAKEEHPSLFVALTYFNTISKGRFTIKMHEAQSFSGPPCYYFFVYPTGTHLKFPIGIGVHDALFLKLAFLPVEQLSKYLNSENEAVLELLKLRLE